MNSRTYELYDENEYFLKYLTIHPILIYSNKPLDKKKLEYQQYLLDRYNNKFITYNDLQQKYNNIYNIERKLKNKLIDIQVLNKKIENDIKNNNELQLIKLYSNLS